MKIKLMVGLLGALLLSFGAAYGQDYAFSLDHVDGLDVSDELQTGVPIVFYIRWTMPGGADTTCIVGAFNGFRVYSDDGAVWEPLTWVPYFDDEITFEWVVYYDGWDGPVLNFNDNIFVNPYSVTGSGADTVGFGGNSKQLIPAQKPGVQPGFDEVVYTITTQVDAAQAGKTLCLDSCYYPPANEWLWSSDTGTTEPGSTGDVLPTWDGPHCFTISGGSAVTERDPGVPTTFALSQNYPNPFNPVTTMNFDLPVKAHVTITIFNVLGQRIRTLVDQDLAAGRYTEEWNGSGDDGTKVASGIYFYKIEAGSFVATKKMMLLK